ncbi:hypothetical protein GCM10009554_11780 [Kribbella koreensis]|uniref:Uncharacterized protein n=1 Tax=Kribbella koreensis TaxID=57909 RepID=A0ABP3ZZA1_9ACTN
MRMEREHLRGLTEVKRQVLQAHGGQRQFNGAGIGFAEVNGVESDEPAVLVAVTKKRPEAHVQLNKLLPKRVEIDGKSYRVDVSQAGPFYGAGALQSQQLRTAVDRPVFHPPTPVYDTQRSRPLVGGVGVGNVNSHGSTGTLGLIVRDSRDGKICILSNNHVLVQFNTGFSLEQAATNPGVEADKIIQPVSGGAGDAVALLKRFIKYKLGPTAKNQVDGALAELTDQSEEAYSGNTIDPLMPGATVDHPAVGMFFAADPFNATAFITKMSNTIEQLEFDLLDPDAVWFATVDDIGAPIEKVGWRTGYSSSTIKSVSWTIPVAMEVNAAGDTKFFWFNDLIMSTRLGWPGDSGSVVYMGGSGTTKMPIDINADKCEFMDAAAGVYDLPLDSQEDHDLAKRIREDHLGFTSIGNYLTTLFYYNGDVILDRLANKEASPTEKQSAAALYDKYRELVVNNIDDPSGSGLVVSQENLDDAAFMTVSLKTWMRTEEQTAANSLYDELRGTLGLDYTGVMAFMDDPARYNRIWDIMAKVPTIQSRPPASGTPYRPR